MPTIESFVPESTIVLQANTQMPSAKTQSTEPVAAEAPAEEKPKSEFVPEKFKDDNLVLKARLYQEKIKRQLESEKRKIDVEKRELEIQKATSRRWQEAAELAQSGRYIEAAEKAGLTYDQLTQQILNGGQIPPQRIAEQTAQELVKKELEAFKAEQATQMAAAQERQYAEAKKAIQAEVKNLVESGDKYLLAKAAESYEDIVSYIESEFHRTGRIVPVEEAIQRWEAEVTEGLELLNQGRLRRDEPKESPKPTQERVVPQTISQRAMAPIPTPKSMSDAERKQRAIDAFYGRLT
jgi:hypothetical protein